MATDPTEVVASWLTQSPKAIPGTLAHTIEEFESATKLHVLLKIAIDDFEKVLALPDQFSINMNVWVSPSSREEGRCSVCVAGAVLVGTYNSREPHGFHEMSDYDHRPRNMRLRAINFLRMGRVGEAHEAIHGIYSSHRNNDLASLERIYRGKLLPIDYGRGNYQSGFLETLRSLQADLEAANI